MVKGLRKSTFREIKSSIGRFLAILFIVALGVGFFAGLRMCQPDMIATGEDYLEEYNMYDYRVISTLGFTDEDVQAFSEISGIEKAEGSVFTNALVSEGDNDNVYTFYSMPESINNLSLLYGELPQKDNECVVDGYYYDESDIGETITLSTENDEDTLDMFKYKEYKIVGVVNSPIYLNYQRGTADIGNGKVYAFMYIPLDGFVYDCWYAIYLNLEDRPIAFTEEYDDAVDALTEEIEKVCDERTQLRYDEVIGDVIAEIDEAQAEIDAGWNTYESEKASAESQIAAGEKQLASGEAQYKAALAKYNSAKEQLPKSKAEYNEAKNEIASAKAELDAAAEELNTAKADLNEKQAELSAAKSKLSALEQEIAASENPSSSLVAEYQAALASYNEVSATYSSSKTVYNREYSTWASANSEYLSAVSQLNTAKEEIASAEKQIAAAPAQLAAAKSEIESGRAKLNASKASADSQLASGKAELEAAQIEVDNARVEVENLEEVKYYLLTRSENIGCVCFESDTAVIQGISIVFPVFFFLVAALVCMTTMTRMIDEQRTQIGVLKALGYSRRDIMKKYLIYSGSAGLAGAIIGYFVGTYALPEIIWAIYDMMYGFAPMVLTFDWLLFVICIIAALLCTVGTTYLACGAELREHPAELIRPKAPKAGKKILLEKIPFIWNHIGFMLKISLRNVFRYRVRMILMIIGIGGCTALLLTGFGIRDSIRNIANDEFDDIIVYDYDVSFKNGQTDESVEAFMAKYDIPSENGLLSYCGNFDCKTDKSYKAVSLDISKSGDYAGFFEFYDDKTGEKLGYPGENEAYLADGTADVLGVSVGDEVDLFNEDDGTIHVTVTGIFTNYFDNYAIISEDTYTNQTGKKILYENLMLSAPDGEDINSLGAKLSADDDVVSVTVNEEYRNEIDDILVSMNYVVLIVLVCAGALAFIVLYNLTNINITERIREIATIKVLGFHSGEVLSYVFRENVVLSVIGGLVGLVIGIFLHAFVMSQIVIELCSFAVIINPISYVLSFILTMVFTVLVAFMLKPKMGKINMAEALKSVD